jgi:hypothetical protein
MSDRLLALFDDPDTAEAAVTALGNREVAGVRVVSPAAYPVVHRTGRPGPWRLMGFLAVAGGLLGLATAIGLEVWSSMWMNLDVGGKAVVAWPAFTVVMFELTMLGAGLTNFTALIVLSWWSRRKVSKQARDAVVADRLAVVVPVDGKDEAAVEAIKRDLAGALSLEVAS